MRSSIRGIHRECCCCQNYSVTIQGKFNKAPTAKTHWFPSLCQGCSRDTQWMPCSVPKKDTSPQDKTQKSYKAELEAAALWLVVGAGITIKGTRALGLCEPPLFSLVGREPPKEERCKSHSSGLVMNRKETCPTPLHTPCASPTGQPRIVSPFSHFVHPGTWNTLLHCSWRECLLSPFLSNRGSASAFKLKKKKMG